MVLSDRDIRRQIAQGRIVIEPYEDDAVQPASVDLRLGFAACGGQSSCQRPWPGSRSSIPWQQSDDDMWKRHEIELEESVPYPLQPGASSR